MAELAYAVGLLPALEWDNIIFVVGVGVFIPAMNILIPRPLFYHLFGWFRMITYYISGEDL